MKHGRQQQAKKIIFVFLVLTLVSSLSASAFLTGMGKVNFVFATKKSSSIGGGSGSRNDGGSPDSSDKGGGGSTDNGGGGTDNSNGGGSGDTSNTSTPPSATEGNTPAAEETTPPPPAAEETTPPPPAANQQTCPGGAAPDANGKCPAPTSTTTPTTQDGGHILVMPNGDGTCPEGSHKFPGSQVCEKDTVPPASGGGTTTTGTPASNAPPLTPQQQYENCLKGIGGGIPGNCKPPAPSSTNTIPNARQLTPQEQYEECLKGIAARNCKPPTPTTTEQKLAPQTLTQKTCPPLPIDANGRCPGIDARGGGLGLPPPSPSPSPYRPPIPEENGAFRLPTVQPIFNDPLGNPLGTCPSGSHKVIIKCVVDNVQCPTLTIQFEDRCSPIPPEKLPTIPTNPDGTCPGVFDPHTNKCYEDNLHAPPCPGKPGTNPNDAGRGHSAMGFCDDPQTGIPIPVVPESGDGTCPGGGVHVASKKNVCFVESDLNTRNLDGSCQSGYFATGNKCSLKIHDPLPDGTCPAGYHNIRAPTAPVPRGTLCKLDELKLTNDDLTSVLPGEYCPIGYQKRSGFDQKQCFRNS